MEHPIRKFRVSTVAKDQLIRLKRFTGIGQWNILCRWAIMRSLSEATTPSPAPLPPMSNVELSWEVFTGPWGDVLWLLIKERCHQDGFETTDDVLMEQFRLHLHRGISYLATDGLRQVEDLTGLYSDESLASTV